MAGEAATLQLPVIEVDVGVTVEGLVERVGHTLGLASG
jgi:hypothetical protein